MATGEPADLCSDCGHTKTCCFSHQDSPFIGSTKVASVLDVELVATQQARLRTVEVCKGSDERIASVGNRAPPYSVKPTLLEMHQQLLV
jgi:hypothetical protein